MARPGGITKHRAPVERPRQQHVGLGVRERGRSSRRRREPLIDGQLPVTTRGGVLGRGSGLVGEQPAEPAVAQRAGRRGSRLVDHLADHVVGELVSDIRLADEMGAQRDLGAPHDLLAGQAEQLGDVLDVEGGAGDDGGPEELLHVGTARGEASGHRRPKRLGDAELSTLALSGAQCLERRTACVRESAA